MIITDLSFPPEQYRIFLSKNNLQVHIGETLEIELKFKNINKYQFGELNKYLRTQPYSFTESIDTCTSYTDCTNYLLGRRNESSSRRKYRKIESPEGLTYYQVKTLVDKIDLDYCYIRQRLCVAIEQVVPAIPIHYKAGLVRKRYRTTFDIGNDKIMLTRVESSDKEELYEVEVELGNARFSKKVLMILPTLFYHIFPHYMLKRPKTIIRPKNLLREDVPNLLTESFTVTNKLDGVRCMVYLLRDCIVASCDHHSFIFVSAYKTGIQYNQVCIDAEYSHSTFYIFDCSYHGCDTTNHTNRLNYLRTLNLPPVFQFKSFTKNILMGTQVLLQQEQCDNDGLIYTSRDGKTVKKWKYPERHSIDFRVKEEESTSTQYMYTYGLYVYDPIKLEEVLFHHSYLSSDIPLENNKIYECKMDPTTNLFSVLRPRTDRKYPNKVDVAEKNWEEMHRPFTSIELVELLTTTSTLGNTSSLSKEYRSLHNSIKRDLIDRYCSRPPVEGTTSSTYVDGKIIVDIGSGKGGDLHKYIHVHPTLIYFIEPNIEYGNELVRRASHCISNTKYMLIPHAFESLEISSYLQVDIVSSFFSFTFFCYTDDMMESTIQRISHILSSGGYFIGTVMNGQSTIQLLNTLSEYTLTIGTSGYIKKVPDNEIEIEISFPDSNTVPIQIESVVYLDKMDLYCTKYGMTRVECKSFKEYFTSESLSEQEIILNQLYSTFVYIKN